MAGERTRLRSPTGLAGLVAAVLALLVLVALGARGLPGAPAPVTGTVGVRVDLTGLLSTALTVLLVLLAVFLVWLLWPDGTETWEPPPRRWTLIATLGGLLLLLVGLYLGRSALAPEAVDPPAVTVPGETGQDGGAPLGTGSVLPLVLALAGAALAAAAVRSLRRRDPVGPTAPVTAPAAARGSGGSRRERAGGWPRDPRRQVIRAYDEMEALLADAGAPREPWEAPREYLARVEQRGPSRGPEPARLTDLFEVARFSHRRVDAAMADTARTALADLRRTVAGDAPDGGHGGDRR